ncbi:MAG TPA: cupin domain-containing protein [Gaiellales bacterium]|jgi:uncharacterized cupin superfamily protein|nr:cupin domain-containing protein [Gaiellales bacterium]
MVSEAAIERSEHGLVPTGDGWFVVSARDAVWFDRPGRGAFCELEGRQDFPQIGINVQVLGPGQPMAMYHWEADQEDFLVVAGQAVLVIEGEERTLGAWDFVHCPAGTNHVIVGAGDGGCVVVAVGGRDLSTGPDWGGYTADESARRHGASVDEDTRDPDVAYARFGARTPTSYRPGWLPGA